MRTDKLAKKSYDEWAEDVWAQTLEAWPQFLEAAVAARAKYGVTTVKMGKPFEFEVTFAPVDVV